LSNDRVENWGREECGEEERQNRGGHVIIRFGSQRKLTTEG
jgi:hypothetical protein